MKHCRLLWAVLLCLCLSLAPVAAYASAYDSDYYCVISHYWHANGKDAEGASTGGWTGFGTTPGDDHFTQNWPTAVTISVLEEKRAYTDSGFEFIVLERTERTISMGP